MRNQQLDDYMVQQIVSRLILPFEQWEAYRYGIIDRKGKVLRKKETLTKKQEKDAWTNLDVLCCNLKKLFMSFPQTQMKLNQLTNLQSAPIPTTIGQPPTYPMSMIKNFFLLKEEIVVKDKGRHVEVYAHDEDDKSIGYARAKKGNSREDPHVEFITVDKEHRGKGVGNAMYDAIEDHIGKPLSPSDTQSDDAKRLWKRRKALREDAPANSAGGGGVAGIGVGSPQFAEPPIKQSNMLSRLYRRMRPRKRLWN